MAISYGELVRLAREAHSPPITAKQLSEVLKVSAPFITDIEKNRRLPSLDNQRKIKNLLKCEQYPGTLFDDLAAGGNDDPRIVAEDLATMIRKKPEIRQLLRTLNYQKLTKSQIKKLTDSLGGSNYAAE